MIRYGWAVCILAIAAGGASTREPAEVRLAPGQTRFDRVGVVDLKRMSDDECQAFLRPGDLIVTHMRLGRVVAKREWLFAVLPFGHAMLVVDPADAERGIFECRFHGARQVGLEELRLYTYCVVYRLRDPARLNVDRLREFASAGCDRCQAYHFTSWLGINDELRPARPGDISSQYTCSTMVAAAYHYAGATLSAARDCRKVITPLSLAASIAEYNEFALPTPAVETDDQ